MDQIGDFMSRDHRLIDDLLDRSLKADGAALDGFTAALARHIDWEERVLFPAFARAVGPESSPSIETMMSQHRDFERALEELRLCPPADAALRRNLGAALVEALSDHNYAEEDHIYPWIDGALPPVEKAAVLKTLNEAREGGPERAPRISAP
jgi:hemerythrin superfamily protein